MMNAELALLHLWASSLSLLRLGQRKTNCVSHIKRWNSVCRGDKEHGLVHLKQQWGTGLSVFLGPYVSDRSTAEDMEDAWWFEPAGHFVHLIYRPEGEEGEVKLFRSYVKSWIAAINEWEMNQKLNAEEWIPSCYWIKDYIIVSCLRSLWKAGYTDLTLIYHR